MLELKVVSPFNSKMGDSFIVTGYRKVADSIKVVLQNNLVDCTLKNVLFVPTLSYDLLLVSVMDRAKLTVVLENKFCCVFQNERFIAQSIHDMPHYLNTESSKTICISHIVLLVGWRQFYE